MDNKAIANLLYETADLLEIDGQDSFRIRSYRNAAQAIENLPQRIADLISEPKKVLEVPGIGKGMLSQGLGYLQQKGVALVFVLGHPDYYAKFGFNAAATADFDGPFKGNPAFMALRLRYGPPMSGRLIYPDAFGIAS